METTFEDMAILGYQLRVPFAKAREHWVAVDRRKEFLLKPDIDVPLSVDTAVWPELDNPKLGVELLEGFFSQGRYLASNGLNLHQIKSSAQETVSGVDRNEGILIGVGVLKDKASSLLELHGLTAFSGEEKKLYLLGFDVSDEWLLSGLMNCGGFNKEHLAARFEKLLNKYGLFNDIKAAEEFATEIAKHVPEHAPFFPVGLFSPQSI